MLAKDLYNYVLFAKEDKVASLLAKGANCEGYKDNTGKCALHWAAFFGYTNVVKLIVKSGAVLDVFDENKWTPLHFACTGNHVEVCNILVECGATLTARTDHGDTALHLAAVSGHLDVVRLLVEEYGAGFLLDTAGFDGETPLQQAKKFNHVDVEKYLEDDAPLHRKEPRAEPPINTKKHHQSSPSFATLRRLKSLFVNKKRRHTVASKVVEEFAQNSEINPPDIKSPEEDQQDDTSESGSSTSSQGTSDTVHATIVDTEDFDVKLGNYRLNFSDPLGHGQFGDVYRAQHVDGGDTVALKRVSWQVDTALLPVDPKRELDTYRILPEHPNIVKLVDGILFDRQLVLVTELCEVGDLERYMTKNCPPLKVRMDFMEQTSCGILHLHSQDPPIAHRDIKPQNILLKLEDEKLIVKIADFGFARQVGQSLINSLCGSLAYIAPDVLPDTKTDMVAYTSKCDIFSLGLVFQAMVLYREGDVKLSPQLDVPPDPQKGPAQQIQDAIRSGKQVPNIAHISCEGNFTLEELDLLIQHMTRYKASDRVSLKWVYKKLNALNEC